LNFYVSFRRTGSLEAFTTRIVSPPKSSSLTVKVFGPIFTGSFYSYGLTEESVGIVSYFLCVTFPVPGQLPLVCFQRKQAKA